MYKDRYSIISTENNAKDLKKLETEDNIQRKLSLKKNYIVNQSIVNFEDSINLNKSDDDYKENVFDFDNNDKFDIKQDDENTNKN